MNEAQIMDSFDGQTTFCHIETRYILGEYLILNEHSLHRDGSLIKLIERGGNHYAPSSHPLAETMEGSISTGLL